MENEDYRLLRKLLTAVVIALSIALLIIVVWKVFGNSDNTSKVTRKSVDSKNTSAASADSSKDVASNNQKRKSDAQLLSSKVSAFKGQSGNELPTAYSAGTLTGPGGKVSGIQFSYYNAVTMANGQRQPLTSDTLVVVGDAQCAEDASTVSSGTPTHDYVIQYVQQKPDGSFAPYCLVS